MKRYGDLATAWFQCIDVSKDGQVQEWLGDGFCPQRPTMCLFVSPSVCIFLCLKSVSLHVLHVSMQVSKYV